MSDASLFRSKFMELRTELDVYYVQEIVDLVGRLIERRVISFNGNPVVDRHESDPNGDYRKRKRSLYFRMRT